MQQPTTAVENALTALRAGYDARNAGIEVRVIVGGQRARVDFQPEGAERAAQAGHFAEQFLGMGVLAEQEMAQRGQV